MKQLAKYLLPLCCGIALASCYGLDKEEYRELAPITVSGLDRTIYAKATETLHLDKLRVESESGQDLVYEWSYGKPAGDFPGMVDTTFISSSPTLDYAFDKAGSYVLRLRIDNGESIGFHYYDLRVQAGFDEGFLILCNDDEGAGSLAFVKKRSPQEEAEGAQEIWDNLLTINPEYDFRSLRDVYVFSSPGYASGILISSGDDEGSIYRLDPVTLIILDGAEISMEELYDLDMYEIERIDVLKDAQASIVYGDRAANGVIVIERQQVTDSKPRLSYNFVPELSIPDLSSMNLCNAAQKLELERLAGLYESDNGAMDKAYAYKLQNVRRGVNTDWIRAPLRVPFSHTHSLSLSGRAQKIDYRASLRFSDKYGVMKGDNRRNYTLNFSIGYHMRDKLTLRYTANYTLTDATDSPYGKFSAYTKLNPYESPYDEYGELVKAFYFDPEDTSTTSEGYQANPLYNATLSSFSTSRNQTLRNTVDAKWYVTKDFYVSGQFNIDVKSSQSDKYVSPDDAQFLGENDPAKRGLYGLGTGKAFNYDGKIVLNYGRNIGQEGSGFVINAGSDIQHTNATTSYITAMGFLKDNLSDIKYALGYDSSNLPSGTETLLAKVGFFASGNIYFRNRYFADVSYRTSGSSAYGKENRFAPMWSFGLGWNLHKEKFLENVEWIDVIRLKWSWGYNGQTTGSPYQAITTYKYSNSNIYYTGVGTVPIRMGNPELKWQRVLKNNFGINLTLFKERLVMSFDYFRNTTKDQLMTIPLPASTGSEDIVVNFGENQNVGYDFSVAGQVIRNKNWAWTSVINGSHVKDRIKQISDKLKNTAYQLEEDNPLKLRFREGGSQYDIYAVRSAGIDPATGQEIFINKNGEYTFKYDAEDEVVVGNTQPKLQGTWLNTLRYKGWSLNFVFSYTFGGDTYNKTLWEKVEDIDPRYNVDERAFTDRWKNPGDLSRYLAIKERRSTTPHNSERFVERLNELWLSSATLTYEFQPKFLKRLGFKRLAVGVGVSDIVRFSTVKYERGTSYPYCRTINLTFRPTL